LGMNCLVKQVIELRTAGKVPGEGGSGRRSKQLLDNSKKTTKYSKLKEKALDPTRSVWRTCFGRKTGPRAKQSQRPRHDNNVFSRQKS